MPLPSSGAISLNEIHIEAGGTTATLCTINDADIRALIGKASGVTMSFSEWYGASSSLYTGTVTVGTQAIVYVGVFYGFLGSGSRNTSTTSGSISPVDSTNFYSGADIVACCWEDHSAGANYDLVLLEVAGNQSNSGWTTLDIAGTTFSRTAGTYYYDSNANTTQWTWLTQTNPFGTTNGATRAITIS